MDISEERRVSMGKMQLGVWYYGKKSASVNKSNNKMMHKQEQYMEDQPSGFRQTSTPEL